MPTWAEITAWSSHDLLREIRALLPSECVFRYQRDPDGAFYADIYDQKAEVKRWFDIQITERLLLLNAYGWLFTQQPVDRNPAWIRGQVRVPVVVQALPTSTDRSGIEDLDPDEIALVYEGHAK